MMLFEHVAESIVVVTRALEQQGELLREFSADGANRGEDVEDICQMPLRASDACNICAQGLSLKSQAIHIH